MSSNLNDEKIGGFRWQERDPIELRVLLVECLVDNLRILFQGEANGQ